MPIKGYKKDKDKLAEPLLPEQKKLTRENKPNFFKLEPIQEEKPKEGCFSWIRRKICG